MGRRRIVNPKQKKQTNWRNTKNSCDRNANLGNEENSRKTEVLCRGLQQEHLVFHVVVPLRNVYFKQRNFVAFYARSINMRLIYALGVV